mgnify:CR=1 FL=1
MAAMQVCAKFLLHSITTARMLYVRSIWLLFINTILMKLTHQKFYPQDPVSTLVCLPSHSNYDHKNDPLSDYCLHVLWLCQLSLHQHYQLHLDDCPHLDAFRRVSANRCNARTTQKPLHYKHILATVFSFGGILLIIQPEGVFGRPTEHINVFCCMTVLFASVVNAFSMVCLRMLK